jgi:sugar phosphate isomerase/epimerase
MGADPLGAAEALGAALCHVHAKELDNGSLTAA